MSGRSRKRSGFDEFIPAKVMTLATLLRRATALRFSRLFGVSLVEWRVVMRLAANPGISMTQLSDRIGLNKGQVSRAFANLAERGLVRSELHPTDTRKVVLSLTAEGDRLHQDMMAAGIARHSEFFDGISQEDLAIATSVIDRLTDKAHDSLLDEQTLSQNATAGRS
jgi:DNA-binding MarR family transcriptional regulator